MDKVKINFEQIQWIPFNIGEETIHINPYISLRNKQTLLQSYINMMMDESFDLSNRYLQAEYGLALSIVELCTTIDVDFDSENAFDIETFMSSGIWEKISAQIKNLASFQNDIRKALLIAREDVALEKSVGVTIDKLALWLYGFLENISELDLSEDGIAKLLERLSKEAEKLDQILPVVKQTEESPKKKPGRPRKKPETE